MAEKQDVLRLEVVTDTDSETWHIGEIDFAVPQCEWLRQMPVRTEAVRMLRFLADALEAGTQPFTWLHREDPDHG